MEFNKWTEMEVYEWALITIARRLPIVSKVNIQVVFCKQKFSRHYKTNDDAHRECPYIHNICS